MAATPEITRGRDFSFTTIFYRDYDNKIVADLTGATVIQVMFKSNPADLDASKLFTKSVGSGVTVVNATQGQIQTKVAAVDTNALTQNIVYYEEIAKLSDGTYVGGGTKSFKVNGNVIKTLP